MKSIITQPIDTRTALLESGRKLFLVHGFEGVSIRQITKAAGTNVAAINYHFNGKINLFREVLGQGLDQITHDKLARMKALDEQQPGADLRQILDVYIRSFFDTHTSFDGDRLMQIIYREMGPDAVASDLVATRLIAPINQAVQKSILKACPDLDKNHVSFCVSSITGQVSHFIRARDILNKINNAGQNHTFMENTVQHITNFSLRGIGSNHHA